MALVFKEQKEEDFVVGTWRIEEDLEWLEKTFDFTEEERAYYKKFLVESRKKQWFSLDKISVAPRKLGSVFKS